MLSSFIITFRECLEAALIIGIILAFVHKKKKNFENVVYLGIVAAIFASFATAYLFDLLAVSFEGIYEQLFEGVAMVIAAILITYMILWMLKSSKNIRQHLEKKTEVELEKKQKTGLFLLSFFAVYREGVETVIFLKAAQFMSGDNSLLGAFIGISVALVLGYIIFVIGKKLNLKIFFKVTSLILMLFAAGLLAHAIHEFHEAGLSFGSTELYNINNVINDKSVFGELLKSLFGYNGNPSFLEVFVYLLYLASTLLAYFYLERKSSNS